MIQRALRAAAKAAFAIVAMAAAFTAPAQSLSADSADAPALQIDLVATGLYLIRGGGGNSLLRLSGNGMVLVDAKSPGNYMPLMAQVKKISRLSGMPLRALLLTGDGAERAGNAASFEAAGVALVAQQNTLSRLPVALTSGGKPAPARLGYEAQRDLHIGGVEIQLRHFGAAHSDGDTVVYLPDLKVVALGALFTPDAPPEPDFTAGGSLLGWSAVLDQILQLDFDRVVPGDGPMQSRADLQAYKRRLDALVVDARRLIREGVAQDKLMARLESRDSGWRLQLTPEQVERFYAELSNQRGQ